MSGERGINVLILFQTVSKIMLENRSYIKLLLSLAVLTLSFLGATFLPVGGIFKGIISFPGAAALLFVMYEILKNEQQYIRNLLLQSKQQDFILSTSSHVAEVAYDKHVLFCEEYINRVQEGRQELFREGATPKTINIGGDLVRIRQKHSAWLTEEIENKLKPFEQVLIEIGANEHYLEITAGEGMNDKKRKVIDKIYRSFGLVLGHEKPGNNEESELHIDKVIDKIRDILGIKAITKLRINATDVAIQRLNSP
ncbi:MAG: hypothetical protein WA058_01145 [Minisyncoccia bacterium]